MLTSLKDRIAAKAARHFCNRHIERYGEVRELQLDSRRRRVEIIGVLHGESTPIRVEVTRYEIEERDDRLFVHISDLTCSRPWLQALLDRSRIMSGTAPSRSPAGRPTPCDTLPRLPATGSAVIFG